MAWQVSADVDKFDEAVDWFRSRVPYTTAQLDGIEDKARARAFWITADLELDTLQTIHSEIGDSIEKGTPFEEFKKSLRKKLDNKVGIGGFHLETVFRNWVQTAYNTGRWYQLTDPELALLRPFLMFDAVLDSRTTERCKACDGAIKPVGDPWWLNRVPPLHHRCRSCLRSLRRKEAERRGITLDDPDEKTFDPKWGLAPELRGDDYGRPDQARFDPAVWEAFKKRSQKVQLELDFANTKVKEQRKERDKRDPEHWYETETKAKYGEHAGKAVAWGKAMEHRGRALTLDVARADHAKMVKSGVHASFGTRRRFANVDDLADVKGAKDAKTLGELIDAVDAADGGAGEGFKIIADELKASASLLGHVGSIETGDSPVFPVPKWVGRWSVSDKERLIEQTESVSGFLRAITDKSVIAPNLKIEARHARAGYLHGRIAFNGRQEGGDLAHEWGHALEDYNAPLREAARGFLRARTVNEPERRLSVLTGKPYAYYEVAKRDQFMRPYMGKIYPGGETELTSMGIELIKTLEGAELYSADPDHFWLVLGMLAGGKLP